MTQFRSAVCERSNFSIVEFPLTTLSLGRLVLPLAGFAVLALAGDPGVLHHVLGGLAHGDVDVRLCVFIKSDQLGITTALHGKQTIATRNYHPEMT